LYRDPQRHTPHAAAAAAGAVDLLGNRPNPIETVYFGWTQVLPTSTATNHHGSATLDWPICKRRNALGMYSEAFSIRAPTTELSIGIISTNSIHSQSITIISCAFTRHISPRDDGVVVVMLYAAPSCRDPSRLVF
jgi:hypothetical protein